MLVCRQILFVIIFTVLLCIQDAYFTCLSHWKLKCVLNWRMSYIRSNMHIHIYSYICINVYIYMYIVYARGSVVVEALCYRAEDQSLCDCSIVSVCTVPQLTAACPKGLGCHVNMWICTLPSARSHRKLFTLANNVCPYVWKARTRYHSGDEVYNLHHEISHISEVVFCGLNKQSQISSLFADFPPHDHADSHSTLFGFVSERKPKSLSMYWIELRGLSPRANYTNRATAACGPS
jgi:hypothetical protein